MNKSFGPHVETFLDEDVERDEHLEEYVAVFSCWHSRLSSVIMLMNCVGDALEESNHQKRKRVLKTVGLGLNISVLNSG